MSPSQQDLVAYALNGLDDAELARIESQLDDTSRSELHEIRRHLAVHDLVPTMTPGTHVWRGIESRLHEEAPRSLFARFWMPLAAAALVVAAITFGQRPNTATVAKLHGAVTRAEDGTLTSTRVSRISMGDGVVITLDTGTVIRPLSAERLALKAGRIFLNVAKNRRGFTVEAGDMTIVTTGTSFLVDRRSGRIAVVDGTVRCTKGDTTVTIAAGSEFPRVRSRQPITDWFTRPTLTARILTPDRIAIVIRNDMPDPITQAPPIGGEPLFYATYSGRSVPLDGLPAPLTLAPDTEQRFEIRLPTPLRDGEALFISSPALNLRVEAAR